MHQSRSGSFRVWRGFLSKLRERGVSDEQINTMLVDNPRRYFSSGFRDMDATSTAAN